MQVRLSSLDPANHPTHRSQENGGEMEILDSFEGMWV